VATRSLEKTNQFQARIIREAIAEQKLHHDLAAGVIFLAAGSFASAPVQEAGTKR
jgi:hypothetical protein